MLTLNWSGGRPASNFSLRVPYGPSQIHTRLNSMVTKEDIEGFLNRLSDGASHKELEPGLWVVKPGGSLDFDVVVNYSPPVVILRLNLLTLPTNPQSPALLPHPLLHLNPPHT